MSASKGVHSTYIKPNSHHSMKTNCSTSASPSSIWPWYAVVTNYHITSVSRTVGFILEQRPSGIYRNADHHSTHLQHLFECESHWNGLLHVRLRSPPPLGDHDGHVHYYHMNSKTSPDVAKSAFRSHSSEPRPQSSLHHQLRGSYAAIGNDNMAHDGPTPVISEHIQKKLRGERVDYDSLRD